MSTQAPDLRVSQNPPFFDSRITDTLVSDIGDRLAYMEAMLNSVFAENQKLREQLTALEKRQREIEVQQRDELEGFRDDVASAWGSIGIICEDLDKQKQVAQALSQVDHEKVDKINDALKLTFDRISALGSQLGRSVTTLEGRLNRLERNVKRPNGAFQQYGAPIGAAKTSENSV